MAGFTKNTHLPKSARAICFLALLNFEKNQMKVDDLLFLWQKKASPSKEEYRLAKEIAYGTCRRKLTLDFYAKQLVPKLKVRERILLRIALYQYLFLDRIPFYAICNETVELAKKYVSVKTGSFFNFLLQKLPKTSFQKPDRKDLSVFYSYPKALIHLLLEEYGRKITLSILETLNNSAPLVVRQRSNASLIKDLDQKILREGIWPVFILKKTSQLALVAANKDYYIQNVTPVYLMECLSSSIKRPKRILDLCVGPGGKLIMARDLYPQAMLYANDISSQKLKLLKENLSKYKIKAKIFSKPAEAFDIEEMFDLILLDVPCSNSGVLHKRCEARWRISQNHLEEMAQLQIKMIENAAGLLADGGKIWYMTCSILQFENEAVIKKAQKKLQLKVEEQVKILPSSDGWDGGFGCCLSSP